MRALLVRMRAMRANEMFVKYLDPSYRIQWSKHETLILLMGQGFLADYRSTIRSFFYCRILKKEVPIPSDLWQRLQTEQRERISDTFDSCVSRDYLKHSDTRPTQVHHHRTSSLIDTPYYCMETKGVEFIRLIKFFGTCLEENNRVTAFFLGGGLAAIISMCVWLYNMVYG